MLFSWKEDRKEILPNPTLIPNENPVPEPKTAEKEGLYSSLIKQDEETDQD